MALVNRWYRILEMLVAQHHITLEEMRSNLNVSMSTLQKSIDHLNDILDSDLQIKRTNHEVTLEVYDYSRLEEILAGSLRKASDFNSTSKRSAYLIKCLIKSEGPLLIDDLAEEIGVSRTTINKDLRHVKEVAEAYHICIEGRPNHGLEIAGSELHLRLLYLHHVYTYFDSDSLEAETFDFLEGLCQTFKIPRKTKELLTKAIAVTVARLGREKPLEQPIEYYTNELVNSEIINQLVYHLELTYHLSLSRYEQDFISFPLNTQYIDGLPYRSSSNQNLLELFQKMMTIVQKNLLVVFNQEQLYVEMHTHLKFLVNRLIFHVQANDIFHGDISNRYPLAFEIARLAGQALQQDFGYPLELSELGYLALYFEMILREDEFDSSLKTRKIAVVCTTGRGTANMICRQLRRVLGQGIAISQYSEEEFNPVADDDYFAIFTTIPLKFVGLKSPIIQITNLFDDQWLHDEWQRVNRYHQKNLETIDLKFLRLSKASSYKNYLIQMAEVLEAQGLVDKEFSKRMLNREERYSTIFGNGIGFPHTINALETKTVLMLGVLEEQHYEGNQPVEFIFLVAVPNKVESQMETELLELYDDIFRISNDRSLQQDLRGLQTETGFITWTRRKGVF